MRILPSRKRRKASPPSGDPAPPRSGTSAAPARTSTGPAARPRQATPAPTRPQRRRRRRSTVGLALLAQAAGAFGIAYAVAYDHDDGVVQRGAQPTAPAQVAPPILRPATHGPIAPR